MKIKTFTFLVGLLFCVQIFSQNIGDYRSVQSGKWEAIATWQVYTASGWVAATQYPGKTSGNYSVTISDGNTITVGNYSNGNNNGPALKVSYDIGDLEVLGQLTLNISMELNNTDYLLIDAGTVLWNQNNVYLKLKQNAEVKIINTGTGSCGNSTGINGYGFIGGSCSNQTSLEIGSITYTNCAGSGNAVAGTFCEVVEAGGTLNATPIASATNICLPNNSVTLTAPSNSNIKETKTYTWSMVSAPVGFTGFSNIDSSSITVNNLIAGAYVFKLKISITKSGKTFSAEGTVTVNVYQPVSSGTVNNINVCSKTNSNNTITLSGYVGTITKWQSSTSSNFTTGVVDIANTSNMLSLGANPSTNLYYRAVLTNGICTGYSAVASVQVSSTTFSGSGWSNDLPDISKKAIISSDFTLSSNITACSVEVNNNAKIIIPANKTLTIDGEVEVLSGNITVESDGSLIQVNSNAVNVGNITVKRKAKLKRNDYNYWGSPVSNQNLKAFSPETLDKRFYTYDEATDGFVTITPTTNNFIAGKGYAIRASATAPLSITDSLASKDYTFVGVPNNGNISYNLDKIGNGYNLVANPYPSNINLDKLYKDNENDITGTFYFWTNINPNPAMQYANYPTAGYYNNYATYNASGGVPPAHPLVTDTNEINKITPEAVIKPGQGFIVKATGNLTTGDGKLNFNNSQRTEVTNTKFLNARMANADNVSIDRYRLQLTTPLQLVNTVLVAYKEGSSLAYESSYDAKLLVESPDSFYTQLNQEKMIIQGRGYPMDISDVVQLGTTFYQPGEHTISLLTKEGVFAEGQPIYLKDKVTGQVINLQTQNYTFTVVDTNESSDRFEVAYVNSTLATDVIKNKEGIAIYKDGTDFVISANEKLKEFKIYDASGKLMGQKSLAQKEYRFSAQDLKSGLYIIDVLTANQRVSKKVIK